MRNLSTPTAPLNTRIPVPLLDELRRLAAEQDRSVSAVVRVILREHLEREARA